MNNKHTRLCALALALIMCAALLPGAALADGASAPEAALDSAAHYVYQTVSAPQMGPAGGEWAVLGLARAGYPVPDSYYQAYISALESHVAACGGVLHDKKYGEYSRVVLALTAIGKDPRSVAGYDLLTPLADFEKVALQGVSGMAFALLALDSAAYPMPENTAATVLATRDMYVDEILRRQLDDGGFALAAGADGSTKGEPADADVTSIVLQALAKYQGRADVEAATGRAVARLSGLQRQDGGFATYGVANSESTAQAIVALGELGIAIDDPRFVKNGSTAVDALLAYALPGGGFRHTADGAAANPLASEQGLYALAAAVRLASGQSSLYRMGDAIAVPPAGDTGPGLPGKHAQVRPMPVAEPGKTFDDIQGHPCQSAVQALAARRIVNGKTETLFDPASAMTRAEFCTIVVKSLGLVPQEADTFADVEPGSWYAGYVGTAYSYGIVNGVSASAFNPAGVITRQEAAVMVARAAGLAGMETGLSDTQIRNMLAQFTDYTASAGWAREALAFCYGQNLLDQSDIEIAPLAQITRGEMAVIIFRLLDAAKLL